MNRKFINDFMHRAFCPLEESRILSQMINITGNGIQYIYYKKLFDTLADKVLVENHDWFMLTVNGYYDLAVYNWSMLFGSHSEPTHYKKLIEYKNISEYLSKILSCSEVNKKNLQDYILNCMGLTEKEYKKIHRKIKDYRDRYLAHREHHPSKINNDDLVFPETNVIKKALESLYLLLIKIIKYFPNTPDKNNNRYVSYLLLNSYEDIEEFAKLTFPKLDALLRNIA
ncbi:hypothetical protein SDC32_11690 [Legionella pneumophila serogroup 8]|nr:hypothetical protein [Legionella pneumophila subsp. pneumophila]HAT9407958.1 hypothetical protein [Legionella pneumophila subsp. pneumophila]HAT9410926.1 hypothetical protein [Legionella pneumophila subsp. pneumophila]HAT9428889.1 hypothetical protein [Legionella pneumophila subsp. pneumophila]